MKIEDWDKRHKVNPSAMALSEYLEKKRRQSPQGILPPTTLEIPNAKPNSKADRHMEICQQMNDTYRAKNEAYGDSFGETFRKLGIISAITRMTDKLNRITALSTGAENNVKDEAVEDTLIDLANYAIMTKIEIELAKSQEEQK